ncbi:MAG: hypothetical protein QOE92_1594 [Chloroflexota bacterium]|jgi:hypothetical protein|nr:hypothetical protein [Chloroflexota bacterium]
MLTMAVGHSDDPVAADAIAAAIEEARGGLGGRSPQAAILFSTVETFDPSMLAAVQEAFPGVRLMGASSSAEISTSGGYLEDSISLALLAADGVDITVGLGSGLGADVDAACRTAVAQAMAATEQEPRLCIVFSESSAVDPKSTLDALTAALPEGILVLGGSSARNDFTTMTPTFQFAGDAVAQDGVAIMLFSGPIRFSAAVGTGWRTLGPRGRITRADDGLVQEIDGRPAVEFLARYLDAAGPATYANPLAIFEAGSEEFYLRASPSSDPETGALALGGSIPVGAEVQLTSADVDEVLAGTRDALERAVKDFPEGASPEAALVFSCAVRKFMLGSRTRVEAEMARSVLGEGFPIAGLYCFGEFAPAGGAPTSKVLNETFVTVLLGT